MRAFDVSQLHQLVLHGAGVAVGDRQVALFGLQRQIGAQLCGLDPTGQYHRSSAAPCAALQMDHAAVNRCDVRALGADGHAAMGQQPACGVGGVDHAVVGHPQCAAQAGAQGGFGVGQSGGVQQFAGYASGAQANLFFACRVHFFVVGSNPQGAAVAVAAVGVHVRHQFGPEGDRGAAERQLGRVVVHHHHMAHTGCGGCAFGGVNHQHIESVLRQFIGAGGTHNACADDDGVRVHVALSSFRPFAL